jgi:hypothetical protein
MKGNIAEALSQIKGSKLQAIERRSTAILIESASI